MNEVICSCFNRNIKIFFKDICINIKEFKFWLKRDCPNSEILNDCQTYEYVVFCENSIITTEYNIINNTIVLRGNFKKCEAWLAKFISQLFQKLLLKDQIIFLNAACVIFNNEAALMIGDFGQGKTSTAMAINESLKSSILLSDNYVAIKDNHVIGATDYISIRDENNYAQEKIKKSNLLFNKNNRDFYNIDSNKNIKYIIKKIIVPFINSGDENFHIVSKEESKWYLYQKMCRLINGETVLFNGILPSPIFNDEESSKEILNICNCYLEKSDILYASSSIENLVIYISNILGWCNE